MNILLLTNVVPYPPDSGPKVKTYHLLRHLAGQHRVTLVSFVRAGERADLSALRPLCAAIHTVPLANDRLHHYRSLALSLITGRPFSVERDSSPAMHALLARLVAEARQAGAPFDLVHADQLHMAPYAESLPLPRLLDKHNAIYRIYESLEGQRRWLRRWLARREAALLRDYEGRLCSAFDAVTTVSEEDRQALLEVMPRPRELTTIPIAIDGSDLQLIARAPDSQAVLSLASPDWPPNAEGIAWFAREVYPLVRRAAPDSQLFICGDQPGPAVRALAERDPSIEVTGFVEPAAYIARSACLIVPLRQSGGMRVMILEALARGIPIVSTSVGVAGLDLRPGEHLLVADTPSDFADAVGLLLREPDLGRRIAAAGRQIVLERYEWRAVYRAIDDVYERITERRAGSAERRAQSAERRAQSAERRAQSAERRAQSGEPHRIHTP
ncbi:glycosyltransferase family 4 protein [Oscillochloris sp. ZM17-4]|uniref:glycosyltransferase n=1 Tax=Oscillochloris sp. ZM17-4 TaxID=2866714 RepID=UPI001C72A6E8|nr:glycosyltransferase [Oscillochloris sp. ZM17-4]MBX0326651.1 glycosyltransferase family 4 protein [Oscillochloris sp. ZM17-4]